MDDSTQEKGVIRKDQIDVIALSEIETLKSMFLASLSYINMDEEGSEADFNNAVARFKDIAGIMDQKLYKYYSKNMEKLLSEKIKFNNIEYNFYEISEIVLPDAKTIDQLRTTAVLEFKVFDVLIRPYHAIATTTINVKKKLIQRIFKRIRKKKNFTKNLEAEYDLIRKEIDLQDNLLNFYCYCLSILPKYDLDGNNIIFGDARTGKSTLMILIMLKIYQFQLKLKEKEAIDYFLKNNIHKTDILYTEKDEFKTNIKGKYGIPIGIDEAYLFADRRDAMTEKVKQLSHALNTNADQNLIVLILIQELSDLDSRFVNKAISLIGIDERGSSFLFSRVRFLNILKDYYGFEFMQKHPYLLAEKTSGEYNIKKISGYIGEIHWPDLINHPLFIAYKAYKKEVKTEDNIEYKVYKPNASLKPPIDINKGIEEIAKQIELEKAGEMRR